MWVYVCMFPAPELAVQIHSFCPYSRAGGCKRVNVRESACFGTHMCICTYMYICIHLYMCKYTRAHPLHREGQAPFSQKGVDRSVEGPASAVGALRFFGVTHEIL